jgi:hypothetical protein
VPRMQRLFGVPRSTIRTTGRGSANPLDLTVSEASRPGVYARLRCERRGSRSGKGAGELRQDGQVSVKLDPLKATNTERQ